LALSSSSMASLRGYIIRLISRYYQLFKHVQIVAITFKIREAKTSVYRTTKISYRLDITYSNKRFWVEALSTHGRMIRNQSRR
jgi:hypothetical protein